MKKGSGKEKANILLYVAIALSLIAIIISMASMCACKGGGSDDLAPENRGNNRIDFLNKGEFPVDIESHGTSSEGIALNFEYTIKKGQKYIYNLPRIDSVDVAYRFMDGSSVVCDGNFALSGQTGRVSAKLLQEGTDCWEELSFA